MFAQIKHAAIYTQNPQSAIAFYEKILGMKRITTAVTENNRGHISDGLIGLAVLAQPTRHSRGAGSFRLRSRRRRHRPPAHKKALPPSDHYQRAGESSLRIVSQP